MTTFDYSSFKKVLLKGKEICESWKTVPQFYTSWQFSPMIFERKERTERLNKQQLSHTQTQSQLQSGQKSHKMRPLMSTCRRYPNKYSQVKIKLRAHGGWFGNTRLWNILRDIWGTPLTPGLVKTSAKGHLIPGTDIKSGRGRGGRRRGRVWDSILAQKGIEIVCMLGRGVGESSRDRVPLIIPK